MKEAKNACSSETISRIGLSLKVRGNFGLKIPNLDSDFTSDPSFTSNWHQWLKNQILSFNAYSSETISRIGLSSEVWGNLGLKIPNLDSDFTSERCFTSKSNFSKTFQKVSTLPNFERTIVRHKLTPGGWWWSHHIVLLLFLLLAVSLFISDLQVRHTDRRPIYRVDRSN